LLRALAGERVNGDPHAARLLAERCACLPLALRVAAELVVSRPDATLHALLREMDTAGGVETLACGTDGHGSVGTVFSWSYRHLPPAAADLFGLLGLHPGRSFDGHDAAALAGTGRRTAGQLLDILARAHLIEPAECGGWRLHDLLREYAVERIRAVTGRRLGGVVQRAALTRLLDLYRATAAAAVDSIHPAERHLRPKPPPGAGPVPAVGTPAAARAWLEAKRATLVRVVAYAATHGWPDHALDLAVILYRYLGNGGYNDEALIVYTRALEAAASIDAPDRTAAVLRGLGFLHWRCGAYAEAADCYHRALDLVDAAGDRPGEARVLSQLGGVEYARGRYAAATDRCEQALTLLRAAADAAGEARVLNTSASSAKPWADTNRRSTTPHRPCGYSAPSGTGSARPMRSTRSASSTCTSATPGMRWHTPHAHWPSTARSATAATRSMR